MNKIINKYTSVIQLLSDRAVKQPNATAFTFLEDGENRETTVTYQQLDLRSRQIATKLQALGLEGERALLLYPSGLDYLAAFFGCLYAGVIAVPAYPPQNSRKTPRIKAIIEDSQSALALTTQALLPKMQPLLEGLQWLATDDLTGIDGNWRKPVVDRETIAFLQYTSGSTGTPKGVMVTHGNLLHNGAMTYRWMKHSPQSKFISWLPIYHDMGLVGGIIQPLYGGFPCVLMSPTAFLQRPYRWLQAISRYGGTTSGAPNFAYDLCVQKITDEQKATLDLSSWQVAFNGAEPIRYETLEGFTQAFAKCGFRREAFYPCYGMAEATLLVAGGDQETEYEFKRVDKLALAENRIVAASGESDSQVLVGCGRSIGDQEIIIVNPKTLIGCEDNQVGEIWVRGESVAKGYWQRVEETQATFHAKGSDGEYLRTGDLGFLDEAGELFITGRLKDLIVIRGRNLYPQDIELTAQRSHWALRLDSNAAFTQEVGNEERLVVVVELEFRVKPDFEEVIVAIRQGVTEVHEVEVYGVVLIKPGSIPKTSSGKIQRGETRKRFIEGKLDVVASSVIEPQFNDRIVELTREKLLQYPPKEVQLVLESYLHSHLARLLQSSDQSIELDRSLTALGMDSIKVFELKNQLEADLGVDIAIADLFSELTLRSLVSQILAQKVTESISLKPVISSSNIHPVSFAQARLWFLDRLQPGNVAYNISFALEIEGKLDVARLGSCINLVISRHEILRTSFTIVEGKPVQVIHPQLQVSLSVVDVLESEAQGITTQKHQYPFDLTQLPLLRLSLLKLRSQHHILLLTMHHIIADGLSAEVFVSEVAQLYRGVRQEELTIQYKDVVYWQQQLKREDILIDYWQRQLKGAPPLLQLPTDQPRPAVQNYQGCSQSWEISSSLTQQLRTLAQNQGVTLFMLLLAAFKTLLYRYTGEEDLVVGSPIANRNHKQLKGLIGFFVNTVVLRSQITGNLGFCEFLSQIRQVAREAYAHQDLPFDQVVEVLQPTRDLSYTPLFQVMFSLQDAVNLATIPGLSLKEFKVDPKIAQFDLTLSIENREKQLVATFEYNSNLFDDHTITRMLDHYQNLLTGIIINPNAQISELPLLSQAEKQQLLVDWNPNLINNTSLSLVEIFQDQVKKNPEAIALVCDHQQLTYQELNQQANQLASYLREIGVKPEVLVGVYLERSLAVFIAILAIIKAGGAYLPLDPKYPPVRIAWMLEDAQPLVILATQNLKAALPVTTAKVIYLDTIGDNLEQKSKENLPIQTIQNNALYTIYTSGSTGKPKGVVCTYGGLVNSYLAWQQGNLLPQGDNNCYLQMASFSFDVFTGDLIKALGSGSKLVICPQQLLLEPQKLYQFMVQEKITCADFVPAVLINLLDYLETSKLNLHFMKLIIVGSDSWYVRDYQRVKRLAGLTTKVINAYGVSEATIDSSFFAAEELNLAKEQLVPIGRPFANTQVYLLDNNLQPVPIGVWGEIYLGGSSLARGYLNQPQLTAERFINNPFISKSLLYKTGDQARYLADGNLQFLARTDNQVKIRGFRIEIAEIEIVIRQHPGVRQGVVIVKEDIKGNKYLVAFIVVKETAINTALVIEEVKKYLKQKLPDYLIPVAWEVIAEIPITVNGKIDRLSLRDKKTSMTVAISAPNKQERIILEIWQTLLQRENITVNDNFFDVGGHSLLLAQLQAKLEQSLAIKIAITDLFKYPTVSSLANYLTGEIKLPTNKIISDRVAKQKAAIARQKQLKGARKI
ncbi:amino acid adenylation domain protein [Chondrocystis sp. NIES-4102]|nr:amino acid adenylation domain protein [Chondrocystis sp. NIES-4102]